MTEDDAYEAAADAIRAGQTGRLQELLEGFPGLVGYSTPLGSLLHVSAEVGNTRAARTLLGKGASSSTRVLLGGTALNIAAMYCRPELISLLLEAGSPLDVEAGQNPLLSAVAEGCLEAVKHLIAAGMDPHHTYLSEAGVIKNALSLAIENEQGEVAEFLVSIGCEVPEQLTTEEAITDVLREIEPSSAANPLATKAPSTAPTELIGSLLSQLYGPVDSFVLQEVVPIHDRVRISVSVVPPHDDHPYLTLFTTGMSDQAMTVPQGQEDFAHAELIMHLPGDWPHPRSIPIDHPMNWPVRWLRDLAYYPHLNDTWLGGRHTIITPEEPPPPLGPDTEMSCLLLIADFDAWSPIPLDDGKRIHFYTVTPLYTEERDFEKQHGIVPLLERLHASGASTVVDLHRKNVALTAT